MLRSMSFTTFLEWMEHEHEEPFDRNTYQLAMIAWLTVLAHFDTKRKKYKLEDFLIEFGKTAKKVSQPWELQKEMALLLADKVIDLKAQRATPKKAAK